MKKNKVEQSYNPKALRSLNNGAFGKLPADKRLVYAEGTNVDAVKAKIQEEIDNRLCKVYSADGYTCDRKFGHTDDHYNIYTNTYWERLS